MNPRTFLHPIPQSLPFRRRQRHLGTRVKVGITQNLGGEIKYEEGNLTSIYFIRLQNSRQENPPGSSQSEIEIKHEGGGVQAGFQQAEDGGVTKHTR